VTAAATALLALLLAQGHGAKRSSAGGAASGGGKRAAAHGAEAPRPASGSPATATGTTAASDDGKGAPAAIDAATGKTIKSKTYTFGAMDVEGKLKTPQLLYFLNRVKLELDMSAPDKRSFMKELEKSADDKNL
jgi:hypothetical protein